MAKHASEQDSVMIGIFKLSEQEFEVTMINMLRAFMGKVSSAQEYMDSISREMDNHGKNQRKC